MGKCQNDRVCTNERFVKVKTDNPGQPITLDEILIALLETPLSEMNVHFLPCSYSCDIPNVPYDYIADLENPQHLDYVLKKMHSTLPLASESRSEKLKAVPIACTKSTVHLAAALYKEDLSLFGFNMTLAEETCERFGVTHPPSDDVESE